MIFLKNFQISKDTAAAPIMVAFYGVEGVGKTTMASNMPGALIVDIEHGARFYDVPKVEDIETWQDILDFMNYCMKQATPLHDSGIHTIVFDSIDALETGMLIPAILKNTHADTLAGLEWGRGYELEARMFSNFLDGCRALMSMGFNIVNIVHSTQKDINPPDSPPFSHYELKLNKKVGAALKEAVDMLAFMNFRVAVVKEGTKNKGKAAERVMVCNHTPYADAKNRFGLDTIIKAEPDIISKYFYVKD